MATHYQVRTFNRFIYMSVRGTMALDDIRRLEEAFYSVWQDHDRILMDYTSLDHIDLSVQELTREGLSDQSGRTPPRVDTKAVYVTDNPSVYPYVRVIEEVWSSFLEIRSARTIEEALNWLELPPDAVDSTNLIAAG